MPVKECTDEEYHAGEGVSRSTLWTAYTKTPFHAKFVKKPESSALKLGKASHIAILEPETFETRVTKGPADRRGNKWKEACDFAEYHETILLTEGEYEQALLMRDLAATVPEIRKMQDGDVMQEMAGYAVDEETGLLVKVKPDAYNQKHKIIGDLKTAASADYLSFQRSVGQFGYHVQEPFYSDFWEEASGLPVDAFFFIVIEKCDPPVVVCYELDAPTVAEGEAIYRKALRQWAECEEAQHWPAYAPGIQSMTLRKYDYRETLPPTGEDRDIETS